MNDPAKRASAKLAPRRVDLTRIADEFALDLSDTYTLVLALAFYWQDRCLTAEADHAEP